MTKIGLISDTHDHFDPKIPGLFQGVGHILHGGDIGLPWIILELERIAPVTAVLGNNDAGLDFKETEIITLAGRKFLIHHIVNPRLPDDTLRRKIVRDAPDIVVFGHSHKAWQETIGRTLYVNPGYAGKPRFKLSRGVAILHCDKDQVKVEFLPL